MLKMECTFSGKLMYRLNIGRSKRKGNRFQAKQFREIYKLITAWKHGDGSIWDESKNLQK